MALTVHIVPSGDAVWHELDDAACICGPRVEEPSPANFMFVHHALDGREAQERSRAWRLFKLWRLWTGQAVGWQVVEVVDA